MKINSKNKLILSGISLLLIAIVVFYFLYDPDKISKTVEIKSYNEIFETAVKDKTGKAFMGLNDSEKEKVLSELILAKDQRVGMVAARKALDLQNKSISKKILLSGLNSENCRTEEQILLSLLSLKSDIDNNIIKSYIQRKTAKEDYYIPFSNTSGIFFTFKNDKKNIDIKVNEINKSETNFSLTKVYDINLLFPPDPDMFLYFPNFDDNLIRFSNSDFMNEFKSLKIYQDIDKAFLINKYVRYQELIDKKFSQFSGLFRPEKLFKDNLSIAKYNDDLLIVTFANKNLDLIRALISTGNLLYNQYQFTNYNNKNFKCTEIKYFNERIFISEVSEYFVISTNKELLDKSIKIYSEDKLNSLGANPEFSGYYNILDHQGKDNFLFTYTKFSKLFGFDDPDYNSAKLVALGLSILNQSGTKYALKGGKLITATARKDSIKKYKDDIINLELKNLCLENIWKYFINKNKNKKGTLDSLERLIGFDPGDKVFSKLGSELKLHYFGIDYNFASNDYSALKTLIEIPVIDSNGLSANLNKLMSNLFGKKPYRIEIEKNKNIYSFNESEINSIQYDPVPRVFSIDRNRLLLASSQYLIQRDYFGVDIDTILSFGSDFNLAIKSKPLLINYLKYLLRLSNRSRYISGYDVERTIKPFLKLLSKWSLIELNMKESNNFLNGNLSIKYSEN